MQSFSINNDNRPTTFTDIHSKQLMLIDLTNLNSTKHFPKAIGATKHSTINMHITGRTLKALQGIKSLLIAHYFVPI